MVRKITFLTIVENTAYFFCKELKYLLPIPITGNCLNSIIKLNDYAAPHIHNTFIRTLNAFGTEIEGVNIYASAADTFLAYIKIKKGDTTVDINSNFEDCIVFTMTKSIRIEISEEILITKGFFVSKDMIEKALIGN